MTSFWIFVFLAFICGVIFQAWKIAKHSHDGTQDIEAEHPSELEVHHYQDSFDKDRALREAFELAIEESGLVLKNPEHFFEQMFLVENSTKERNEIFAESIDAELWPWPEGMAYLKACGNRGTFKQKCALLTSLVYSRFHGFREYFRMAQCSETQPYAMFDMGPTPVPCARHAELRATVFSVDDPVFIENPIRPDLWCRCRIRSISQFELERLENSGVQDALAPQVKGDSGLPTGHREKRLLPIVKSWEK